MALPVRPTSCHSEGEVGSNPLLGGQRNPYWPWDYFNPTGDGVNRVDDILAVVNQYREDYYLPSPPNPPNTLNPNYTTETDRTLPMNAAHLWSLEAPNGQQRVDDILNSVYQYHHDCA